MREHFYFPVRRVYFPERCSVLRVGGFHVCCATVLLQRGLDARTIVRHQVGKRPKGGVRGSVAQVDGVGCVEARIVADLLRPARVLVARLEELSPIWMERFMTRLERLRELLSKLRIRSGTSCASTTSLGNQRQSEEIRGNQRQSRAIRGNQLGPSEAIRESALYRNTSYTSLESRLYSFRSPLLDCCSLAFFFDAASISAAIFFSCTLFESSIESAAFRVGRCSRSCGGRGSRAVVSTCMRNTQPCVRAEARGLPFFSVAPSVSVALEVIREAIRGHPWQSASSPFSRSRLR